MDTVAHKLTAVDHQQDDDSFIDEMLQGTSRTFALAIPLLTTERRRHIGLSYLLFRVADSIEDAPEGDAATKISLLTAMRTGLNKAAAGGASNLECLSPASTSFGGLWPTESPTERLLRQLPRLMALFGELPSTVANEIRNALASTISGMIRFIDASKDSPDQIQIQTVSDLRLYCYAVAGVVGEMLTDIFVFHHPPGVAVHNELRQLSVGFGEFLQLTNILKDAERDATCGRVFIPIGTSRDSIFQLAYAARQDADMYISILEKNDFPTDILVFCRFLCFLAEGSLSRLQSNGAGSKLTRDEVMRILSAVKSESTVLPV
ncbi:MAG: squalene/phytoene synthase family protein [Fuerstia sp.]|nr:squalene/phytoene synthase family protein [Fuerstiella sp.]